jgi:hypothetical protein
MRKGFTPLLLIAAAIIFAASCIKDRCGKVVCLQSGVCVDGICACRTGYEGATCEKEWSAKFAGNWQANENYFRSTEHHQYSLNISKTGNADSFILYNLGDSMHALCKEDKFNSFTFLPNQVIDSELTIASGNGTLDDAGTKIVGTYSFKLKDSLITTSFSWTK